MHSSLLCHVELSQPPPENSGTDDVNVNERTSRHHREFGRRDRWINASAIAVSGGGGHGYGPALDYAETGSTLMTDGQNARTGTKDGTARHSTPAAVGRFRARKSPRLIGPLSLGSCGEMEPRLAASLVTERSDDSGNQRGEVEEGNSERGKWSWSEGRIRPRVGSDIVLVASDGGGSGSDLRRQHALVRNDRCEGTCSLQSNLRVALVG